jgi:phytoene dehydrogenase-like protein
MPDYDAIIIGAGMSGLAAGIRLAMFDKKVLILEQHNAPGGLNSYYNQQKRAFDVGLHALTNYAAKGERRAPLTKLLRQLRIPWDDLQLREQVRSEIQFPGVTLPFTNDFEVLRGAVREAFPSQVDAFDRFVEHVLAYDNLSLDVPQIPARPVLEEFLSEPLLIEMLFCPLMYYGSAVEDDMEFGQFCTMFRSILVAKILTSGGKARGVALEGSGEEIHAPVVISTAGYLETLAITEDGPQPTEDDKPGMLTFVESIICLDVEPKDLGIDQTIIFFNDSERFHYRAPDDLLDLRSGVVCMPNNYLHDAPLSEGLIRMTSIASWDGWSALNKPEPYASVKAEWHQKQEQVLLGLLPDFREHVTYRDVFTPTTIHHYTRHINGAVYGAPRKIKDGLTSVEGLFIAGTDQGFLGIVGAMLSGISIANARVLMPQGARHGTA